MSAGPVHYDLSRHHGLTAFAWVWLAVIVMALGHNAWLWLGGGLHVDTDVMALLPAGERDPALDLASRQMADAGARRVVVLVGHTDWAAARRAATAFSLSLAATDSPLQVEESGAGQVGALSGLQALRGSVLSTADRVRLAQADVAVLARQALASLHQPFAAPRLVSWREDPLNLLGNWLLERADGERVQWLDGVASVVDAERRYVVLRFVSREAAFSINAHEKLQPALARAGAAARDVGGADIQIAMAGVPLHAASASARAQWEIGLIGGLSLLGIVLLAWACFRSLRPVALVVLSVLVGCLVASSLSVLLFGRVHLITLVFGASLVGVAEDYGIHYLTQRQAWPFDTPQRLMRVLLPTLALAMATSVTSYLALAVAPLPGLRQMAVFAACGLCAAFITVVGLFPVFDRSPPAPTAFSHWLGGLRRVWPSGVQTRIVLLLVLPLLLWAASRVEMRDSLRNLQGGSPALHAEQLRVNGLLGDLSLAQFFIVRAADSETLLQREEALTAHLRKLSAEGRIAGHRALSDLLPSQAQRSRDAALIARAHQAVAPQIAATLGGNLPAPPAPAILRLEDWLTTPSGQMLQPLWLGEIEGELASIVQVRGLHSDEALSALAALAGELPGVRWVDRAADYSALLAHYRERILWLLGVALLACAGLLAWRYGLRAWQALAPPLLGLLTVLALLGVFGIPLQLFHALAMLIVLGMGLDYGIFLVEDDDPDDGAPWLGVSLGAMSTLLSFGLLAFSATPALHAFGLTVLVGIAVAWLSAPFFTRRHA